MGLDQQGPLIYRITVTGGSRDSWRKWLGDQLVAIERSPGRERQDAFLVEVQDQAALRGILNKLWDINLSIVSVVNIHTQAGGRHE